MTCVRLKAPVLSRCFLQGISADALSEAAVRCADTWEHEPDVAKRTASACAAYLWRVHGVDYFAGACRRQLVLAAPC